MPEGFSTYPTEKAGLGLRGNLVAAYCYWYYKENGDELFSAAKNNTTRRNGHKLLLERFRLEIRKNFYNGRDKCNPGRGYHVVVWMIVLLQAGGRTG